MIALIYGTDIEKKKEVRSSLLSSFENDGPIAVSYINEEGATKQILLSLAETTTLFGEKNIVFISNAFTDGIEKEYMQTILPALTRSENVFIFEERSVTKTISTLFNTKDVYACEEKKKAKVESTNSFLFTDACAGRDKKQAWVLYTQALLDKKTPEELHGLLFWQMKTLYMVSTGGTAEDFGINPYVYSKSKRVLSLYKEGEIKKKLHTLVTLFHEARRGGNDLKHALEHYILTEI